MPRLDAVAAADLIDGVTAISARAALAIRATGGAGNVSRKADGSPVTAADLASEAAIRDGLAGLAPELPIVSEEQAAGPAMVAAGESYFLVDPLDGTREFIDQRDEYTVNIAVMADGAPLLGVIAAPALGLIWRGIVGGAAECLVFSAGGTISPASPINVRPLPPREPVVLISRSHLDARTQAYLKGLPQARTIPCGSALKFCRIAEGSADLYPRLAPTRDWDTAAGHAIIVAAGGLVLSPEGGPLRYGTKELLIPGFIAAGDSKAF